MKAGDKTNLLTNRFTDAFHSWHKAVGRPRMKMQAYATGYDPDGTVTHVNATDAHVYVLKMAIYDADSTLDIDKLMEWFSAAEEQWFARQKEEEPSAAG